MVCTTPCAGGNSRRERNPVFLKGRSFQPRRKVVPNEHRLLSLLKHPLLGGAAELAVGSQQQNSLLGGAALSALR